MSHPIFQMILDCRSLTVIEYLIDQSIGDHSMSDEERSIVDGLMATNCLDTIWLRCCEVLGHEERAITLRAWLEKKKQRGMR